ncbi:hypothetical protein F4Z99_02575 [Candidatus Poribacteria bacterium]|nr:hypothetical protein [Candidatus Poribacteria bacterium]MYB01270.1 hypothetical protein [Candidatus Poribacteria bacterium]
MLFKLVVGVSLFIMVGTVAAAKWEVISELPTHRKSFSTAVVDGKIYLIGGTLFEHARGVLRDPGPGIWRGPFGMSLVEVYDPETNTWQRLADMPTVRAGAETTVVDGKIYVMGGYAGEDNHGKNFKILKAVEMYDPQTDTWVRKQELPVSRMQFGIGAVAGKIYAIGGVLDPKEKKPGLQGRLDLVEVYDPVSDTWAKRADMPTRRDGFATAVIDDTIYAIGGNGWPQVGAGGPALGTIEVYEPRVNRWRKSSDMPNLRRGFVISVIADKIYLIGGSAVGAHGVRGERLTSTEVYNPATKRWRLSPTPPAPTLPPFSTATINGKIYAFGGTTEDGELSPTVKVFDTGLRAVTAKGKLPTRWGALKIGRQN